MRAPLAPGFVRSVERLQSEGEKRRELAARVIPFNVSYLDDCCLGIYPTDLIVMSAAPGAGKTTLGALLAQKASASGRRVNFFALEAHRNEIEQRMFFRELYATARDRGIPREGLSFQRWMYGQCESFAFLESDARERLEMRLINCSTFYRETAFNHEDVTKTFLAVRGETDLIVLDHLHYVDLDPGNENAELKRVIKAIRDAALDMEIPVIVIAHLRKKDMRAKRIIPDIDDIHGSSDIVKVATKVVLMAPGRSLPQSDKQRVAMTIMQVAKDRFAGTNGFAAVMQYDLESLEYRDTYALGRLTPGADSFEDTPSPPAWAKRAVSIRVAEDGTVSL